MFRTRSLLLVAAAPIGAIALYVSMDLPPDRSATALEATIPASADPIATAPSSVSETQPPEDGAAGIELTSHEEEPPPPPASALPPMAEQVTANWEDNQRRRTYGDLLKLMRLTPADERQFLALLASRYSGETEEDERAGRETELGIQTLLKGHWPQFVAYEGEMEERIYVMQCDEVMAAHDARLDSEQRRLLVTMMAQTRRNLGDQPAAQPGAWMERERVFQANTLRNATAILKADQLAAFREALQQQLEASQVAHDLVPNTVPGTASSLPIPGR